MKKNHLLEEYLKRLRLSTVLREYPKIAKEAARNGSDYEGFLLALVEQEALAREANGIKRRIKQAGFPREKSLDEFDFSCLPSLNKTGFLELYRSTEYIVRKENVVLIDNNGTGKIHLAIRRNYHYIYVASLAPFSFSCTSKMDNFNDISFCILRK